MTRNPNGFRDEVIRTLVGTVVLTRYNNKTYRIDDIIWNKNPAHTFTAGTTEMSFIDYYKYVVSFVTNVCISFSSFKN